MDWFHGSSLPLQVLRAGSTITQNRDLARIFSHKPHTVCIDDDERVLHTGESPGFLYRIAEPIGTDDILPHPTSTMQDGLEWLTLRNFTLTLLEETTPFPEERLTSAMLAELQARRGIGPSATVSATTSKTTSTSFLLTNPFGECRNPVLLYGTKNPAKLVSMRDTLRDLPLELLDLSGTRAHVRETPENGETPMENAVEKAMGYWHQLRMPVFSIDSGLYFNGVEEKDQPGVHIRRMHGHRMNDTEMVNHYAGLARKYGGFLEARYRNAFCLVLDDAHCIRYEGPDIDSESFFLVDRPHAKRQEGFPLDSISVEIRSGLHYYDLSPASEKQTDSKVDSRTKSENARAVPKSTAAQAENKDKEVRTDLGVIDGFRGLFSRTMPLLRKYAASRPLL